MSYPLNLDDLRTHALGHDDEEEENKNGRENSIDAEENFDDDDGEDFSDQEEEAAPVNNSKKKYEQLEPRSHPSFESDENYYGSSNQQVEEPQILNLDNERNYEDHNYSNDDNGGADILVLDDNSHHDYHQNNNINHNNSNRPPRPSGNNNNNNNSAHSGLPPRPVKYGNNSNNPVNTLLLSSTSSQQQQQQNMNQENDDAENENFNDNNNNINHHVFPLDTSARNLNSDNGRAVQVVALELKQIYKDLGLLRPDCPTQEGGRKSKWLVLASHLMAFFQHSSPIMEPEEWERMNEKSEHLKHELDRMKKRRNMTVQVCRAIEIREGALRDLHQVVVSADEVAYNATRMRSKLDRSTAPQSVVENADSVTQNVKQQTQKVLKLLLDWAKTVGSRVIGRIADERRLALPNQIQQKTSFVLAADISDSDSSGSDRADDFIESEDAAGRGASKKTQRRRNAFEQLCELFSFRGVPYLEKIRQDSAYVHQTASLHSILSPHMMHVFRKFSNISALSDDSDEVLFEKDDNKNDENENIGNNINNANNTSSASPALSRISSHQNNQDTSTHNNMNGNDNSNSRGTRIKKLRHLTRNRLPYNIPLSNSPQANQNNISAELVVRPCSLKKHDDILAVGGDGPEHPSEQLRSMFSTSQAPSVSLVKRIRSQVEHRGNNNSNNNRGLISTKGGRPSTATGNLYADPSSVHGNNQKNNSINDKDEKGGDSSFQLNEQYSVAKQTNKKKSISPNSNTRPNKLRNTIAAASDKKKPLSPIPHSALPRPSAHGALGKITASVGSYGVVLDEAGSRMLFGDQYQQQRQGNQSRSNNPQQRQNAKGTPSPSAKNNNNNNNNNNSDHRNIHSAASTMVARTNNNNIDNNGRRAPSSSSSRVSQDLNGFANDDNPENQNGTRQFGQELGSRPWTADPSSSNNNNKSLLSPSSNISMAPGGGYQQRLLTPPPKQTRMRFLVPHHANTANNSPSNNNNNNSDDNNTSDNSPSSNNNNNNSNNISRGGIPGTSGGVRVLLLDIDGESMSAADELLFKGGGKNHYGGNNHNNENYYGEPVPPPTILLIDDSSFNNNIDATRDDDDDDDGEEFSGHDGDESDDDGEDQNFSTKKRRRDKDGLSYYGNPDEAPSAIRGNALKKTAEYALALMGENEEQRKAAKEDEPSFTSNNGLQSPTPGSVASRSLLRKSITNNASGDDRFNQDGDYTKASVFGGSHHNPNFSDNSRNRSGSKQRHSTTRIHQIVAAEQREKRDRERAKHDAAMMRMKHPAFRRNAYSSRHARNAKGPAEYWSSVVVFFVLIKSLARKALNRARARIAARKIASWFLRVYRARAVVRMLSDAAWNALAAVREANPKWTNSLHLRCTFDHAFAVAHMRAFYIQKAFYRYRLRSRFINTVNRVVAALKIQNFIRSQFQVAYKMRVALLRRSSIRKIQRFFRIFRIWSNPVLRQPAEQQPGEDKSSYKRRILNATHTCLKSRLAVMQRYDKSEDRMIYADHTLQSFLDTFKLTFEFSDGFTWRIRNRRIHLDGRVYRFLSKSIRIVQRFAVAYKGNNRLRQLRLHYQVHRFYTSKVIQRRMLPTATIKPFLFACQAARLVAAKRQVAQATSVLQRVAKNFPEMRRRVDANHRGQEERREMLNEFAFIHERESAARKIQNCFRSMKLLRAASRQRKDVGRLSRTVAASGDNEREYAALRIQTAFRRYHIFKCFMQARRAWAFIKREWVDMWQFMKPVLRVQMKFRQILKRNREFARHKQRRAHNEAALTIQAVWHAAKETEHMKKVHFTNNINDDDNDDDDEEVEVEEVEEVEEIVQVEEEDDEFEQSSSLDSKLDNVSYII